MRRFLGVASVAAILSLGISGCGTATPKVDICKQVMQIASKYADLQRKSFSDPELARIQVTETVEELNQLASALPAGPQREYLEILAMDYGLYLTTDWAIQSMWDEMPFLAPEKIAIVCPK